MAYFDQLEKMRKLLQDAWDKDKGAIYDIAHCTGIATTTLYNIVSRAHPTRAHTLKQLEKYFKGR